jgi:demethylspheroidene O-methyltransferase
MGEATRLHERWLGLRNRLIASPRFQQWASSSPLTRSIARRRARALFDLCAGFVYSQTLLACVRLRIFDILKDGPREAKSVAHQVSLPQEATSRLLSAAASLKLLRALPNERYVLADLGAAMLANPSIGAFVEHHTLLYDDLRDPVGLLRQRPATRLSQFWPYAEDRPGLPPTAPEIAPLRLEAFSAYSALMSQSQTLTARTILDAYPISNHQRLLDVGGGEGAFLVAAAERAPALGLMLFDLPCVAERARANIAKFGLSDRVQIFGGSFLTDALPRGADLISLLRIVHDHDDESALVLLRAARAALCEGGAILVGEPMSHAAGIDPVCDAYFGFYLLAMGRGRPRTTGEHAGLLRAAGFSQIRVIPTRSPMLSTVVTGKIV